QMPDGISEAMPSAHIIPVHLIVNSARRKPSRLCCEQHHQKREENRWYGETEKRDEAAQLVYPSVAVNGCQYAERNRKQPRKNERCARQQQRVQHSLAYQRRDRHSLCV